jgi:hypothetical protein
MLEEAVLGLKNLNRTQFSHCSEVNALQSSSERRKLKSSLLRWEMGKCYTGILKTKFLAELMYMFVPSLLL